MQIKIYDNCGNQENNINISDILAIVKLDSNKSDNLNYNIIGINKDYFLSKVSFNKNNEILEVYFLDKKNYKFQTKKGYLITELEELNTYLESYYEININVMCYKNTVKGKLYHNGSNRVLNANNTLCNKITILKDMGIIYYHSMNKNFDGYAKFQFDIC
ncbi:hypothetical protein [Flavobacterium sp.]|uniref:hypothetical protein n=1 Tax=Flavobacterium sp. TaxID=239 RepID=UPI0022C43BCC|nr:hypothetical protein [Flavobacterium sp.]MCZ8088971.1 hypothetical protein [Flavobacterium sp.]